MCYNVFRIYSMLTGHTDQVLKMFVYRDCKHWQVKWRMVEHSVFIWMRSIIRQIDRQQEKWRTGLQGGCGEFARGTGDQKQSARLTLQSSLTCF